MCKFNNNKHRIYLDELLGPHWDLTGHDDLQYIYVCMYIHVRSYTVYVFNIIYTYGVINIYIYIYTDGVVYIYILIHRNVIYVYIYKYIYIYIHKFKCIYIYNIVYVYIYKYNIYMYIYIYICICFYSGPDFSFCCIKNLRFYSRLTADLAWSADRRGPLDRFWMAPTHGRRFGGRTWDCSRGWGRHRRPKKICREVHSKAKMGNDGIFFEFIS